MPTLTPDTIVWQEYNADGTKYALLEGRKDKAGASFTYAFFIPAGMWDTPHYHSTASQLTVLSGKLKLGYGEQLDKEQAAEYPAGSQLLVPAEAIHFDGADEDTIIIGQASGIWKTTYL